ncbi:hypothetical protein LCGC14_1619520 [marine sediment metagenome]|uniref:Uncharacterized protein n=1 Tax=marine sediment metagenome TaxID=412755 RepID=A0A0F9I5Z8_9ZZZZ
MPLPVIAGGGMLMKALIAYMLAREGVSLFEKGAERGLKREELALTAESMRAERTGRRKAVKESKAMTMQMIERLTKEKGKERTAGRESQALAFILGMGQQGMGETQNLAQIFSGMADRSVGGPTARPNSMASLLR